MRKNKVISVILSVIMLLSVTVPAAFAADILNDVKGLFGIFGFGTPEADEVAALFNNGGSINLSDLFSNTGGLLDVLSGLLGGAAEGASSSDLLSAIMSLLGGETTIKLSKLFSKDFLDSIQAYLAGEDIPVSEPTTRELPSETEPVTQAPTTAAPTTTEPPTTAAPTTQAPPSPPVTEAPASTVPYTPPTTLPQETSTVPYVAPELYTTNVLSPDSEKYSVTDENGESEGVSAKMIIGIIILVLSGGAVVAVAVILKKTRV